MRESIVEAVHSSLMPMRAGGGWLDPSSGKFSFILGFLTATLLCFFMLSNSDRYSATSYNSPSYTDTRQKPWEREVLSKSHGHVINALNRKVRVFCWIMTHKGNTQTKAIAVNQTWLRRCDGSVFVTVKKNSGLPVISGSDSLPDGYDSLWFKTRAAFQWIYENKINDYDWFLKADDDTYVVMENLRLLLLNYNPDKPLYLGCKFKVEVASGYMSGGAGYVLSRKALELLGSQGLPDEDICTPEKKGLSEDVEIGRCMENLNVSLIDTREHHRRHRMLPMSPTDHLAPHMDTRTDWLAGYIAYPYKDGKDMVSDYVVTFHYVEQKMMYALEYLLYSIRHLGAEDTMLANALAAAENENRTMIEILTELSKRLN